jgi:tetratricopeptide (TPR) repeat protein
VIYAERAICIFARVFGEDSPRVPRMHLANLLCTVERTSEASALCERALLLHEPAFAADPHTAVNILNGIANAMPDEGRKVELLERALALLHFQPLVDEWQLMIVLNNFANALGCIGEQVRRKLILQQCLALNEKSNGVDSIRTATSLHNLGLTSAGLQEWPEAQGYYERAHAIHMKHFGAEHLALVSTLGCHVRASMHVC